MEALRVWNKTTGKPKTKKCRVPGIFRKQGDFLPHSTGRYKSLVSSKGGNNTCTGTEHEFLHIMRINIFFFSFSKKLKSCVFPCGYVKLASFIVIKTKIVCVPNVKIAEGVKIYFVF